MSIEYIKKHLIVGTQKIDSSTKKHLSNIMNTVSNDLSNGDYGGAEDDSYSFDDYPVFDKKFKLQFPDNIRIGVGHGIENECGALAEESNTYTSADNIINELSVLDNTLNA